MNGCETHHKGQDGRYVQCGEPVAYTATYVYRGEMGEYAEPHQWCNKHFADELRITAYAAEWGDGEGWDEMRITLI